MGTGWRKAFCTSIRRDTSESSPSRRTHSKLKLFSTSSSAPVTPRLPSSSDLVSPRLRCKTSRTDDNTQCSSRTGSSSTSSPTITPPPRPLSNPCSPRSPSRFSLLKNSLRFSKNRCGICLQSVKAVQGTAIFIAECSHSFHFPCIAAHVRKQANLVCPVCATTWRQLPLLSVDSRSTTAQDSGGREKVSNSTPPKVNNGYSDDEPLNSPGGSRFNPIPEDEDEDEEEKEKNPDGEFQGFFSGNHHHHHPSPSPYAGESKINVSSGYGGVGGISVLPDVALLSSGRNHDKHVVAVKVKAAPVSDSSARAPIDLVMVLDVGEAVSGSKFQTLKRSMKQLIASLAAGDRLSLVAFASNAKRLLPFRRMTPQGQRAARRIVDRLICGHGTGALGDALRKATRILEDRRERNPVASIMLLSDGQAAGKGETNPSPSLSCRSSSTTASAGTRFAHIEIPVCENNNQNKTLSYSETPEDAFARCVGGLLSVVAHDVVIDLKLPSGAITAVYSINGQPTATMNPSGTVSLGDLYAEEERDLLVEIRVPAGDRTVGIISKCNFQTPAAKSLTETEAQVTTLRLTVGRGERLRNLFITTRAVTEARRLTGLNDSTTAAHLLTSARSLLLQTGGEENVRVIEAELAEVQRRRGRRRREEGTVTPVTAPENETLTPTSAWRAAERLAKLAIMRKSLNRVSDLHGFEDARF